MSLMDSLLLDPVVVTATVDTTIYTAGHGLSVGEVVYISKASFDGGNTRFSGYFTVTAVDTTSPAAWFQFALSMNRRLSHLAMRSAPAHGVRELAPAFCEPLGSWPRCMCERKRPLPRN